MPATFGNLLAGIIPEGHGHAELRIEMNHEGTETQKPKASVKPVPGLDPVIGSFVEILRNNGIKTFESCQGGCEYSYPEPTIRFHGSYGAGFKAFAIACDHALPVHCLRRTWSIEDREPAGPFWEMTFYKTAD